MLNVSDYPEGRIPLADAVIDLCLAPKSNSGIKAIDEALADVENGNADKSQMIYAMPHYHGAKQLGPWYRPQTAA